MGVHSIRSAALPFIVLHEVSHLINARILGEAPAIVLLANALIALGMVPHIGEPPSSAINVSPATDFRYKGHENPREILDRRKHEMHITWQGMVSETRRNLAKILKEEADEYSETRLDDGFSVDLMYAIRQGHNAGLNRLRALALTISSEHEQFEWFHLLCEET